MRTLGIRPMLLMLLLLCAGVLGMHTLGHQSEHLAFPPAHAHAAAMSVAADDCCGHPQATALSGHNPTAPMSDPTAVCLAILCAVALIIAFFLLRRRTADLARSGSRQMLMRYTGRAPPGRPRLGLLIADLAVSRN